MTCMEVVYLLPDGCIVRSLAFYSYRCGPVGEWTVGDIPLRDIPGPLLHQGAPLSNAAFELLMARHGRRP